MKVCKKCGINKSFDEYGNDKNKSDGKLIYCKECEKLRSSLYRKKNPEKSNLSSKNWRKKNPQKYKKTIEDYLDKNPHMSSKERIRIYRQNEDFRNKNSIKRKEYYKNNLERERYRSKEYYHQNKSIIRKKNNEWKNNKRKKDGFYRMKLNLRDRLRDYLTGESKSKRTQDIVGLDKDKFKVYIESKFVENMSWDNYGKWHLDHIIPLCSAKNNEEALQLNYYSNLQPLWDEENLKKNRTL